MTNIITLGPMASGSGSSVEALYDKIKSGELEGFDLGVILCNKPPGKAGIYERGERMGVPVVHASDVQTQIKVLEEHNVDLVLGLGYIKIVEPELLYIYKDRVLNIHPTLLPKYGGKGMYGLNTHMAVLEFADTITGPTVHLMNEEYDKGRILRQVVVPVPAHLVGKPSEENAKELQQYVLQEEYQIMPEVLRRIHSGVIDLGF